LGLDIDMIGEIMKGGNAYEVILGDVIGDRNFKGGF